MRCTLNKYSFDRFKSCALVRLYVSSTKFNLCTFLTIPLLIFVEFFINQSQMSWFELVAKLASRPIFSVSLYLQCQVHACMKRYTYELRSFACRSSEWHARMFSFTEWNTNGELDTFCSIAHLRDAVYLHFSSCIGIGEWRVFNLHYHWT